MRLLSLRKVSRVLANCASLFDADTVGSSTLMLASVACAGALPNICLAAEAPEQPLQELFLSDTVYPQEKGEFQFTLAPSFRHGRESDRWDVPVSIEYGLSDSWQVELEWAALRVRNPRHGGALAGTGDVEVGTQYSFLNIADSPFHAAARFDVQFPLGDVNRELGEGFIEYQPSVILARDIPQWHNAQLFTQVGFGLVQRVRTPDDRADREPAAHELVWNSGVFVPFSSVVTTLEFSWRNNQWNHGGDENEVYLTPGAVWKLPEDIEVGVGVPFGLNRQSDSIGVITTLTWEF